MVNAIVKDWAYAQCRMCLIDNVEMWLSKDLYKKSLEEFNTPLCHKHQNVVRGLEKDEERMERQYEM